MPSARVLRERVARRMRSDARTFAQRSAAARACRPGSWAENDEVLAAALEFDVRIRVWEGSNRMWITFGDGSANPLLYMYNDANVHFEPLEPM